MTVKRYCRSCLYTNFWSKAWVKDLIYHLHSCMCKTKYTTSYHAGLELNIPPPSMQRANALQDIALKSHTFTANWNFCKGYFLYVVKETEDHFKNLFHFTTAVYFIKKYPFFIICRKYNCMVWINLTSIAKWKYLCINIFFAVVYILLLKKM